VSDSKSLRRATLMQKVPHYTTLSGAAAVAALKAGRSGRCRSILRGESVLLPVQRGEDAGRQMRGSSTRLLKKEDQIYFHQPTKDLD
jgi:hypothetical protein